MFRSMKIAMAMFCDCDVKKRNECIETNEENELERERKDWRFPNTASMFQCEMEMHRCFEA